MTTDRSECACACTHAAVGKSEREFTTCDLLNISDCLVALFTVSASLVYGIVIISSAYFYVLIFFSSAIFLLPLNAVKLLGN